MTCLTPSQIASLALGPQTGEPIDERLAAHVANCAACRATLSEMRQLTEQLSAAHAAIDQAHAVSRARLMTSLSDVWPARSASVWNRFSSVLGEVFARRRVGVSVGLSTAAGLLLLVTIFATSATRLSAMDRMLAAVREVSSYSFKQEDHTAFVALDGSAQTFHHENYSACWRAPGEDRTQWLGDLHAEIKSWHTPIVNPGAAIPEGTAAPQEKLTLHLAETYPCGKLSLIVIYTEGYYFWAPPVPAGDLPVDNTIAKLRAVQQGQGKIVRELGTKRIDGREARGYLLAFDAAVPFHSDGPVEVWVDPQTDLPMDLSYQRTDTEEEGRYVAEYRLTDIRWNIDFPPDQFATVAPAGLTDTTPPTDEKDIDQIIAALKLYADLNGGEYPQIRTLDPGAKSDPTKQADPRTMFDGQLIHDKMLQLAGFTGPPQPAWSQDSSYQRIEAASGGFGWLSRVLLNRFRAGFDGSELGPQEKDKVLLWWTLGGDRGYRVFYGDLRTEIVTEAQWAKLVPTAVMP
jgi:hypothetical protein